MSEIAPPADVPAWAVDRARSLLMRLGIPSITERIVQRVLLADERALLPAHANISQVLLAWMRLRSIDLPRAVIDLALRVDLLSPGEHEDLKGALGPGDLSASFAAGKPEWDHERAELRVGEQVVRRFHRPGRSRNRIQIIEAFQESGWRARISDPLAGGRDPERLRDAIRALNSGLLRIRFFADGTGEGIRWEEVDQ